MKLTGGKLTVGALKLFLSNYNSDRFIQLDSDDSILNIRDENYDGTFGNNSMGTIFLPTEHEYRQD